MYMVENWRLFLSTDGKSGEGAGGSDCAEREWVQDPLT